MERIGNHARVFEYDGAYKCMECQAQWGALTGKPQMPERCESTEQQSPPEASEHYEAAVDRPAPSEKHGEVKSGTEWMASQAPTRGEGTLRDLRRYAGKVADPDDRELVQHAADMLEVALRSTTPAMRWRDVRVTAPCDGDNVLAYWCAVVDNGETAWCVAHYYDGRWHNPDDDEDEYRAPDFWMQLPAAPDNCSADKKQG